MLRRPYYLVVAALLALTLVAAACGSSDNEDASDAVRIGALEPAGIDPIQVVESEGADVARLLFDGLTTVDSSLAVVGAAASSWSSTADSTVFTFTLRDGMSFTNGDPVDAEAFAFSFARLADPDAASPVQDLGAPILGWSDATAADTDGNVGDSSVEGIVAVDDLTLEITTTEPFALLPSLLTHPAFAPVPPSVFESEDSAEAFADEPIGNGRYAMAEPWQHEDQISLVRNDDYYGTAGVSERIDFVIFPDTDAMYARLEEDRIDVSDVPVGRLAEAQDEFDDRVEQYQTAYLLFLGMPVNVAPYDDEQLRTALSLSIDRDAIATRVLEGTASVATGVVPPLIPGTAADTCASCRLDTTAAQDALAKADVDGPLKLYTFAGNGTVAAMRVMVNDWKSVLGLDVELVEEDPAVLEERLFAGELDGMIDLGWVLDYPSGYSIMSTLFATDGANNFFGYSSPEFDAALDEARRAPDLEATNAPLESAERIVGTDLPAIPFAFSDVVLAFSDRTSDVVVNGLGSLLAEQIKV